MRNNYDRLGADLLDGKDCAGGACSASDIGDAIRKAVMDEREACAHLAEQWATTLMPLGADVKHAAACIAAEIRERN